MAVSRGPGSALSCHRATPTCQAYKSWLKKNLQIQHMTSDTVQTTYLRLTA